MSEYEFDVAFSFHSLDEALAVELNDRIQDRFKTFIYFEHQKLLAGRDGEERFGSIFQNLARVVVVFCRKEWGATPFTRIEETAIRNRAFEQGFDFTLFIPTDNPPTVPKWLPKARLYYALGRFGLDGAAAAVEQLIQHFGGDPRIESVADRAARQRAADFKRDKERFEKSEQGVKAANNAFIDLSHALHDHVVTLQKNNSHLAKLRIDQKANRVILSGMYPVLVVQWDSKFANSLNGAVPSAGFYAGMPSLPGYNAPWEEPIEIKELQFHYHLLRRDFHGYVERDRQGRIFSPEDLADHLMRVFMDISERGGDSN